MTTVTDDSTLADYSHGHDQSVLVSHATRTAADSCGYFLDRLKPGARVLDLGCGPGSITLDLARIVGPEGQVVGVDAAPAAIEAASRAAEALGDERTRFLVGDVFDPPVEAGGFDVVHAHQMLQHLADPVAALQTMGQMCAPGGIVVARDADYAGMHWFPASVALSRWREIYSAGARAHGSEPNAGRRLLSWANTAGLRVISAGSSTWTYADDDSRSWWASSQARRVRCSNFAAQAAEQGCTPEQIEQIAQGWERWGANPDGWFCMPHGEIIASPEWT
ncbi:methyltransferase domain-containing protein [Propionibacterium australiense]|uniref:Class I SAM-dependent methyltransferase n=2 Tax=Propionibacterium australiense TaxID=119981 RepID=A0A8B3FRB1_9ACTN|nr:methyltransferase domain-containing protein [Propionibacterium australiense]RLP08217.1 class I SAM-dependent methyltransferase [Propionibacterium australiense]